MSVEDVRAALESEGFTLSPTRHGANVDPVEQAFGALFRAFLADEVRVVVFTYPTEERREMHLSNLSIEGRQLRVAEPSRTLDLGAQGRVLVQGNSAILIVTDDTQAMERILAALESVAAADGSGGPGATRVTNFGEEGVMWIRQVGARS